MRRIPQTKFGAAGNCLEACLASILELDREAIPVYDGPNENMSPYLEMVEARVLYPRGKALNAYETTEMPKVPDSELWIALVDGGGEGFNHAVVMRGMKPEWAPDPKRPVAQKPDFASRLRGVIRLVQRA